MAKTLNMVFKLDGTKELTYSLTGPKEGLTKAAVEGVMQDMITKTAILKGGVAPTAIKEAYIREVTLTALA